eukprot:TRINITY_DN3834_c0_g1_i12.p1 TRINITY_DN3834_c0_g1~~TRINITY_DN3834_c0_g1_i12.p1  ORF type:complete len:271 (-),score=63.88 TRINITY_DN3834_c0_g1_i12:111-923(-)
MLRSLVGSEMCIRDRLYINGTSLLQEQLSKRREVMKEYFQEIENKLQYAKAIDTDKIEEIEAFLYQSVKMGCEGLMVKTLDKNATYELAKRSFKWLKLKKDYLENGLADSCDLVPIGADFGEGKRTGLYGSFLLACYNDDLERFETVCKIGTGFSDEILQKFHKSLSENIIKEPLPEYKVNDSKLVDVWFSPHCVWEVRGADIQISPVYSAGVGRVDPQKGLGLRFPRLVRLREDKGPYDATSSNFIVDLYRSQAVVANGDNFNDDEDYY